MAKALRKLIHSDAASGVFLVAAAVLAMLLANTPLNSLYDGLLNLPVVVAIGEFKIAKPLLLWVNDGLMALFFLMVGLEIKREVLGGHLSSVNQVMLPGLGAVAGIIAPALIYAWFNWGNSVAINGWAIPSATDIAFALGVFSFFGSRLPTSLKLFLLSVAIFDDIGAIIIIAIFYSTDLSTTSLIVAATGLVILFVMNRMRVNKLAAYMVVGVVVWAAVLKSGVHATLAGFCIAWAIPLNVKNESGDAMLPDLEHSLQPWVAFAILPIFAFVNAGVRLVGIETSDYFDPVTLGIVLGLFLGKQLGIFSVCWIAIKTGLARMPLGADWRQLYAVCLLCGIGFTMSLFIGTLAFDQSGEEYRNNVKLGVLIGSLVSAMTAAAVLSTARKSNNIVEDAINEKPQF